MPEIRAILTDLDGVIRIWDRNIIDEAERAGGLPVGSVRAVAFDPPLLHRAITGEIDDEAWRGLIRDELARRHPDADAARAVAAWSAPAGAVNRPVLDLLRRCRQRVPVVLVTNATSRLPRDLAALGLDGDFDHVANSSAVGAAKPDPAIFRHALAAAGAAATEALFIDDAPINVEAATTLGMTGHLFDGGVEELAGALARYGLT